MGHSLGAATALLCAVQYGLQQESSPPSIITFGGPRLCNAPLAEYWMKHCFQSNNNPNSVVVNLVHSKDPILQQNQALWDATGFAICGQEVLCESDTAVVYEWDEAIRSNALVGESKLDRTALAFNFWDHCMYLGTFVGPRLV